MGAQALRENRMGRNLGSDLSKGWLSRLSRVSRLSRQFQMGCRAFQVLILQYSDTFGVPMTKTWARGREVGFGSEIAFGTAIARYVDAESSSNHSAVFMGQGEIGIYVLDQWHGGSGGGRLHYRVLEWNNPDFTNSARGFSKSTWSQKDKSAK